jgi:2-polyprenyl-3-methyl-5-hydroxy-6-metoxy-1,4-benzoquinol methylase
VPDWQERITRDTEPAIRVEHQLRYALAAPIVHASALWCDLGCGTGVGAAHGLGGKLPGRTLLVDVADAALEHARRELPGENVSTMQADLSTEEGVAAVAAALTEQAGDGPGTITCFECIEHLASFVPLVSKLVQLAERHGFTVLLSVPNDAFWSIENPHHQTSWGESAFEELRTLLPADHVLLRQVVLQGSAVVRGDDAAPDLRPVDVELEPRGVPSHLLVAFGPERERVALGAAVSQVDMEEQRRWERQREADLSLLKDYGSEIHAMSKELADYRAYIHDLERRLGLPLSGEPQEAEPSEQTA